MSRIRHLLATALVLASLATTAADPINLNAADAETIASGVSGIGPSKAAAIVAYRDRHGPFKSVDDLLLVRGIGEATLDNIRDQVTTGAR